MPTDFPPVTDLCDDFDGKVAVLEPLFSDFGGLGRFCGPAATIRTLEDNTKVRARLEEPGKGRVLVVDGFGSLKCALVGGNLADLGDKNGWAGILVNGCVRDSDELKASKIGIKALGLMPRKSVKDDRGEYDVTVNFAGATISSGDYIYADADGIIVSKNALHSK